jgi:hypothetical protein
MWAVPAPVGTSLTAKAAGRGGADTSEKAGGGGGHADSSFPARRHGGVGAFSDCNVSKSPRAASEKHNGASYPIKTPAMSLPLIAECSQRHYFDMSMCMDASMCMCTYLWICMSQIIMDVFENNSC